MQTNHQISRVDKAYDKMSRTETLLLKSALEIVGWVVLPNKFSGFKHFVCMIRQLFLCLLCAWTGCILSESGQTNRMYENWQNKPILMIKTRYQEIRVIDDTKQSNLFCILVVHDVTDETISNKC